ncbi:hypothetical protein BGX27_001633 [Mortierella sp. AM989]|nr:hypothetical protein BGX27_001633 [Mortierella sp. AM989]
MNARPPQPNQRPPSQYQQLQQQQLQPPMQNAVHGGRSPIMSPFQKQGDPGAGHSPNNPNFRSIQQQQQQPAVQQGGSSPVRLPPNGSPGSVPTQRPPMQQQPRPNAPPTGQQSNQFTHPGRPMSGLINPGSQAQMRPGAVSPQTPPSQALRPPMQGGQQQQQPPQAHQPASGGPNLRPSASHPSLAGGATGNRFTPPSPSLSSRSPQIRPLQSSPQSHGSQGNIHMPQQQQQQQQHQAIRPSMSQTHLVQQPGVRPPPVHGSPVQAHQATSMRPPHPNQQQPRPRPPQTAPPGQSIPQQAVPGHAVQSDMLSLNDNQSNGGQDLARQNQQHQQQHQQQQHQQPQQRPPGARPILDQMRHQVSQNQPVVQGQVPQNLNPTQRQPQRPPAPLQAQPPRQHNLLSPPQKAPMGTGLLKDLPPNPSATHEQNMNERERQSPDMRTSNGEHGLLERPSPQQHHLPPPNQRVSNAQQSPGTSGHQQYHSPSGPTLQSPPPRPYIVPGSPGQKPLGATGVKAPGGPTAGASSRPPPALQHNQQQSQIPQQPVEPESIQLKEPDVPLSDMDENAIDGDDIEGGSETIMDRSPPQASSVGGPPSGPPRGPPRKLSGAASTGPVRILPPSNNPSSPPPNAFQSTSQPRSRVRPPPGNKVLTPYRPPERPSHTPVMYSQSGQPALSQPFSPSDDKPRTDQTPSVASIVPQGAESASSSVRPKEGGLQKRVFAGENNASKPDAVKGSSVMAPPSPRLHGNKGPAILSVSGQKKSSSSVLGSVKKWVVRGTLVYLGYTAVFNCAHDTTGVKGYYCKATNGLGGLVKPYLAPHYNAHLGPHVDRYVKPATRQGHRIYLKVADPVVQGAVSLAGTVYKSTAKKHVDSAKDQVISILPYPFKPKSVASKDNDQASEIQQHGDQEVRPEVNEASQQPTHTQEPAKSDESRQVIENDDSTVDSTVERVSEKFEVTTDDKEAQLEQDIPAAEAAQQQESEDSAVEATEKEAEEIHVDEQPSEYTTAEEVDHSQTVQNAIAPEETENNGHETDDNNQEEPANIEPEPEHQPNPVPAASVELEPTLTAADEQPNGPIKTEEITTQVEDTHDSSMGISADETVESVPEFADHPTEVSDGKEKLEIETETAAPVAEVTAPQVTFAEETASDNAPDVIENTEKQDEVQRQTTDDIQVDDRHQEGEHKNEEKDNDEYGHEQQEQGRDEGDLTPEQQAAPISETEHEDHPKTHDEL